MLVQDKQAQAITFDRDVAVAPNEVYRAFTNEIALQDWLSNAADIDPRIGGRIYIWWDKGYHSSGTYTALERGKTVAFTWRGPNDPTSTDVTVTLTPLGDDATHIQLTHSGLGPGEEWAQIAFQDKRGWESALENLQSILESGTDLRVSRRPMFGLSGGNNLDDKLAAKLGVPVSEGLWIGGLVDGLGAQKAGIQKDDVIVGFGGQPVTNFASFAAALQSHRAGDQVDVDFYRGSEKRTVTMQLSERPAPNLPPTHDALLEGLQTSFAELNAELEAALEGVTEQEAAHRSADDEWNIKEILAHLITSEQGNQGWTYAVVEDLDTNAPFYSNDHGRMKAFVSVHDTIPALLDQLKRTQAVTVAQVAAIPPEAQAHKHQYNLLVGWLTAFQTHFREHIAEIQALAQAARA
jgi:uncharacterized protein YndB with AHSA1/START domain